MSLSMEIRGVDIVVIPAYQPSEMLPDLVKKVVAAGYGVIVVDDGSAPDKQWIFEQLNNLSGVVVLHHVENTGKGAALKTMRTVSTCRKIWNAPSWRHAFIRVLLFWECATLIKISLCAPN